MANYQFLDAFGSVLTAASSTIGGVEYPIVKMPDIVTASVSGTIDASIVGTVPVTQSGTWFVSVLGQFAEDTGHSNADRGFFQLGVRNDAVASFVGTDRDYTPMATDSAGRSVVKPFAPDEALISGVSSTVNINPSSLIAGAGAGLRNYITDILVANTGSVATLVSFRDGDASVIGRTIAPATSGSNIHLSFPMRTGGFNQPIEFTATTAVSILSVSAYGYKAP